MKEHEKYSDCDSLSSKEVMVDGSTTEEEELELQDTSTISVDSEIFNHQKLIDNNKKDEIKMREYKTEKENDYFDDAPSDVDYDSSDDETNDTASVTASDISSTITPRKKLRKRKMDEMKNPKTWYEIETAYPKDCPAVVAFSEKQLENETKQGKYKIIKRELVSKKKYQDRGIYFRFSNKVIKSTCIRKVLTAAGFQYTNTAKWNVKWGLHMKPSGYKRLNKYQKFNHFPGSWGLGRKDSLHKNLSHMRRIHGPKHYDFFPNSWILPQDKKKLKKEMADSDSKKMYIVKPKSSCCGRGIKVVKKYQEIRRKSGIISEYLSKPMLINEAKFDLRLYVVMTSIDPLRIYLYNEGLCRISTHKYTLKKNSRFVHLTNYSVNKKSKHFIKPPSSTNDENLGHKWSLTGLRKYWKEKGVNDKPIWEAIHDLIIKTILSVEGNINLLVKKYIKCTENVCFELFGFDVLIDENGKPFILEVNNGPSLSSSSPMDKRIKTSLVRDIYQMIGVVPYERKKLKKEDEKNKQERLFIPASPSKPARRSLNELQKLNRLDYLTDEDRSVICETACEYARKGNFERIFPTPNTHKYNTFFTSIRYKNEILNKFFAEPTKRQKKLMGENYTPLKKKKSASRSTRTASTLRRTQKINPPKPKPTRIKKTSRKKKTRSKQDIAMEKLARGVTTRRSKSKRRYRSTSVLRTIQTDHLYKMDDSSSSTSSTFLYEDDIMTPPSPSHSTSDLIVSESFFQKNPYATIQRANHPGSSPFTRAKPRRSLSARPRTLLETDELSSVSLISQHSANIANLSSRFEQVRPSLLYD